MKMTKLQPKGVTLEQIQAKPFILEYVEHPTEEQQLMAVRTNAQTLSLFTKNQTEYVAYEAIKQCPTTIAFSSHHSLRILLEVAKRQDAETLSFLISKINRSKGAFEGIEELAQSTLLHLYQNGIPLPQTKLIPFSLGECWINLLQGWREREEVETFSFFEQLPEPFVELFTYIQMIYQVYRDQTTRSWVWDQSEPYVVIETPEEKQSLSLSEVMERYPTYLEEVPLNKRSYRLCRYAARQSQQAIWASPYHITDALREVLPAEVEAFQLFQSTQED